MSKFILSLMETESKVDLREFEGSYLELFLLSAIVFVLFVVIVVWQTVNDFSYWYNENYVKPLFLMLIMITHGWLLLNALGCAYNLLPIIHQTQFFRQRDLRIQIWFCLAGQVLITSALFQSEITFLENVGLLGLILNAVGLSWLAIPSLRVSKNRLNSMDQLGKVAYSLGIIMPVFGCLPVVFWLVLDTKSEFQFASYVIATLVIGLINLTFLISHFERRLGWKLIPEQNKIKVFGLYLLFTIFASGYLFVELYLGVFPEFFSKVVMSIPFFWMFYSLNPKKVLANLKSKYPCSYPLVIGYLMILFNAIAFLIPQQNSSEYSVNIQPFTFLLSSALLINIGYGSYMNDDHLYISVQSRKKHYFLVFNVVLSSILMFYLLFVHDFSNPLNLFLTIIWLMVQAFIIYSVNNIIYSNLGIGTTGSKWSSTPMFYNRYQISHEE